MSAMLKSKTCRHACTGPRHLGSASSADHSPRTCMSSLFARSKSYSTISTSASLGSGSHSSSEPHQMAVPHLSSHKTHLLHKAVSDGGAGCGGSGSSGGGSGGRGFGGSAGGEEAGGGSSSSSSDDNDSSLSVAAAAAALATCSMLSLLSAGAAAAAEPADLQQPSAASSNDSAAHHGQQQQQQDTCPAEQQDMEQHTAAKQWHEEGAPAGQQDSLQHHASGQGSSSPSDQSTDPQAARQALAADSASSAATTAAKSVEPTPKRIVLFIEPSPFTYMSGYQTRFLATIQELQALGCEVLVVTPGRGAGGLPGGQPQPSEFAGAKVVEAGSFPCPGYDSVPLSLGLSPRIFNEVRAWQPDVIHVTSPGALPVAAWLYSRILRVPLVASYHTHVPSYLPRLGLNWLTGSVWGLIRTIHKAAHLTIAVSPKTATDLVDAGACDSRTVRVWPKAVDCERFHPHRASPSMRARLAGGSSNARQPLLLYVGRVSPEKNVQLLLSVLEQLPGARLAVVGDGPALADMQALFKDTPTVFTGKLTGLELAAAYASADVFVMPSETETLGNVVGEAMASGLPVVAAAAGGVPSFISRPGETGFLFPPGDAKAAAAQVKSLLSNPKTRQRMSESACADMQRFSWRSATQEILRAHYPAAMLANRAEQQRVQDAWLLPAVSLPPTAACP